MLSAQTRGQTLLPLPYGSTSGLLGKQRGEKLNPKEQEQLQLLESAALTWTQQIKQALDTPAFESLSVSCGFCITCVQL